MNVRIEINYIRHPKCCICRVYTNVLSDNIHMMFVSNAHIKVHKSRKEAWQHGVKRKRIYKEFQKCNMEIEMHSPSSKFQTEGILIVKKLQTVLFLTSEAHI